jgi:aminocarboxymuconate-semialdehyde decarboxylase
MGIARREFLGVCAAAGATMVAGCAAPRQGAGHTRRSDGGPVIDVHAHWHAPAFVNLLEKEGPANGAKVMRNAQGHVAFSAPGLGTVFQPSYIDLPTRLRYMDEQGVDVHALSLTSPMVHWAPTPFGVKLAQVYNDELVRAHQEYPRRFVGLATLPMQTPTAAVRELERIGRAPGIRGVYLSTHINGKNLDEKEFFEVYAKCEELGLHVYLHPVDPVGGERMRRYYLRNFLGNPYDTGIAAASLMFGGVMDAFPRLEVTRPPSAYLRRFHYDTISHHVPLMTYLVGLVGADRVVLGTDHPADMSLVAPVPFVEKLPQLSQRERNLILGGNAQRLLGL